MNQNDINVIRSMFPCLERAVEARFGLIGVFQLMNLVDKNTHYKHVIKLAMMRLNYACVNSFDTGGIYLYIGRDNHGEICEELHAFRYEPDEHFKRDWRMEQNLKNCFMNWWDSVLDVFDTQKFAVDFVNTIKMDLVSAVINREHRLNGIPVESVGE